MSYWNALCGCQAYVPAHKSSGSHLPVSAITYLVHRLSYDLVHRLAYGTVCVSRAWAARGEALRAESTRTLGKMRASAACADLPSAAAAASSAATTAASSMLMPDVVAVRRTADGVCSLGVFDAPPRSATPCASRLHMSTCCCLHAQLACSGCLCSLGVMAAALRCAKLCALRPCTRQHAHLCMPSLHAEPDAAVPSTGPAEAEGSCAGVPCQHEAGILSMYNVHM